MRRKHEPSDAVDGRRAGAGDGAGPSPEHDRAEPFPTPRPPAGAQRLRCPLLMPLNAISRLVSTVTDQKATQRARRDAGAALLAHLGTPAVRQRLDAATASLRLGASVCRSVGRSVGPIPVRSRCATPRRGRWTAVAPTPTVCDDN